MKKRNNEEWENLFPLTLMENVFDNNGVSLTNNLSDFNDTITNDLENTISNINTSLEQTTNDLNQSLQETTNDVTQSLSQTEENVNNQLAEQNAILQREINQKNAEIEMIQDKNEISLGALGSNNGIASWWTTPLAFRSYEFIFHGYTDNKGGVWTARYNNETKEQKHFRVSSNEIDDHNAPSIFTLSDGRVITFYTRHNEDQFLRYRISESVRDIDFGDEQRVNMYGLTSYAQGFVERDTGRLFVLTRVSSQTWHILSAPEENITDTIDWEINQEFVNFGEGNQGYLKIRYAPDRDICRVAFSGHPTNGNMHDILYCYFRTSGSGISGDVVSGGSTIKNIFDTDWTPLELANLQMVYNSNNTGKRARLFDIGDSLEICFVEFTTLTDGQYKYATWNGTGFDIKDVTSAGKVFGGGSKRYYYGGMMFTGHVNTGDFFLSRYDDGDWVIERYTTPNDGDTWNVREIERSSYYKLIRPYAVNNPSSFEHMMYSKGIYSDENYTEFNMIIKGV